MFEAHKDSDYTAVMHSGCFCIIAVLKLTLVMKLSSSNWPLLLASTVIGSM